MNLAGTIAFSSVEETSVGLLAATPPNLTAELLLKPTPLMSTTVPAEPDVGLKPVIDNVTMNGDVVVQLPHSVFRVM
jgi:hypothetical protein